MATPPLVSKLRVLRHAADKLIRGFVNRTPIEAAQLKKHTVIIALLA
jgi:hypothetical protein